MRKASMVVSDPFFERNRIFDVNDAEANRDDCLFAFYLLKQEFAQHQIALATSDIHPIEGSEIVIYNEMPKILPKVEDYNKSYLLLFESELIRPDNWDVDKHKRFRTIFTWHDDYIDSDKYCKINFSLKMPSLIPKAIKKDKLCTLIAGNKKIKHPLELYSKRVEVIRWFEKEHPNDFDFYGVGWDKFRFSGIKAVRALNKIQMLTRLLAPIYPSYKGVVQEKKTVLKKYKFSICYENAKDIPGYITEKIFDCFFAGCIPVYWGASNVLDYIPKKCFVDMRDFSGYEMMYDYLMSMSDNEYLDRLHSIEDFLCSDNAFLFSADSFVQVIKENCINDKQVLKY